MPIVRSEREEFTARIQNRLEALDHTFARLLRNVLQRNDMETLARIERAKKSVAAKGAAVSALLESAEEVPAEEWSAERERIQSAWTEYREAVDRARLELDRAEELS